MKKIAFVTVLLICLGDLQANQSRKAVNTAKAPLEKTHVLIVSGINKDPNEHLATEKAVSDLRHFFLNNAKVRPKQLMILTAEGSLSEKDAQVSTAKNLEEAISKLKGSIKPSNRFIFYYTGQANVVANKLRINLPGMDITHYKLAELLNRITASSTLIVLDCPAAGLTAKVLTKQGRIIICACTGEQRYSTRFSKYFVPALTDKKSDTDHNGKISVLEAFTLASRQLDELYRQQLLLKTETPVLEDDQNGIPSPQPWRFNLDGKDGRVASNFFLSNFLR